jgi:hypothetical protein
MKTYKNLFFTVLIAAFVTSNAQNVQKINPTSDGTAAFQNLKKVQVAPLKTFKLPYSIQVFSTGELDQDNKTHVTGRTIKGSVSNLSGMGGGASTASYAKLKITITQPESGDTGTAITDENGNFSVTVIKDSLHIISVNGADYGQVRVKTKHDTVKNSINNVR